MKQSDSGLDPGSPAPSPSFSGYSSGTMAEVADRVVGELAEENGEVYCFEEDAIFRSENSEEKAEDCSDDFEFAVPGRGESSSPASADEIFCNGQIRPLFPLFNTDLVFADTDWRDGYRIDGDDRSVVAQSRSQVEENSNGLRSQERSPIRLSLKNLMISERPTSLAESVSGSSSEADDLEGVAPETYCAWTPSKQEMRKKSKSTGYSKRWKIRDLLYRSQSDGGDTLAFFPSKQQHDRRKPPAKKDESPAKRKDTMAVFANMNGLSKTIQPF